MDHIRSAILKGLYNLWYYYIDHTTYEHIDIVHIISHMDYLT